MDTKTLIHYLYLLLTKAPEFYPGTEDGMVIKVHMDERMSKVILILFVPYARSWEDRKHPSSLRVYINDWLIVQKLPFYIPYFKNDERGVSYFLDVINVNP